jgi:ADP-ribose pyrophosphatase YjhB (NUDIX family)
MTQEEWEHSVQWIGIVAGSIIREEGKYLMVQEAQPKVKGLWNVPAGYVDKDEDVKVAAIREAKEESGYDIELDGLIGLYHDSTNEPLKHVYRARIVGGELKAQEDEIMDAKWLGYDEIKILNENGEIRARWIYDAITKVEEEIIQKLHS